MTLDIQFTCLMLVDLQKCGRRERIKKIKQHSLCIWDRHSNTSFSSQECFVGKGLDFCLDWFNRLWATCAAKDNIWMQSPFKCEILYRRSSIWPLWIPFTETMEPKEEWWRRSTKPYIKCWGLAVYDFCFQFSGIYSFNIFFHWTVPKLTDLNLIYFINNSYWLNL